MLVQKVTSYHTKKVKTQWYKYGKTGCPSASGPIVALEESRQGQINNGPQTITKNKVMKPDIKNMLILLTKMTNERFFVHTESCLKNGEKKQLPLWMPVITNNFRKTSWADFVKFLLVLSQRCPIPLKSTQASLHFLTPLIRYNLKKKHKQKQKYFERTSKKLILDQKKTLLTHFEHDKKSHFCPLLNACHEAEFQKNLMEKFREELQDIYFSAKKDPFIPCWHNNFPIS